MNLSMEVTTKKRTEIVHWPNLERNFSLFCVVSIPGIFLLLLSTLSRQRGWSTFGVGDGRTCSGSPLLGYLILCH